MSLFTYTIATPALLVSMLVAMPLPVLAAANPSETAARTLAIPRETVEHRITELHKALRITAAEETDWNGVAKAMQENAAVMDKLMEERTPGAAGMTAVDDLKFYEKLSRAHVEGLKGLTDSFTILYTAMPDAQKKTADQVFKDFGHGKTAAHG